MEKTLSQKLRDEVPFCENPKDYSEWELVLFEAANKLEAYERALRTIRTINDCYKPELIQRTINLEITEAMGANYGNADHHSTKR